MGEVQKQELRSFYIRYKYQQDVWFYKPYLELSDHLQISDDDCASLRMAYVSSWGIVDVKDAMECPYSGLFIIDPISSQVSTLTTTSDLITD